MTFGVIACASRGAPKESSDGGASPSTSSPNPARDPISALEPYEAELRRGFDFAHPPSAETGLGPDPWAIRRVATGWVGVLRGRSAVVLLDDDLHEIARVPAPRSPTGLAVAPNGDVLVVGELSPVVARFAVRDRALVPAGETRVPGVTGLRDVAVAPSGVVWVVDEAGGRALRLVKGQLAGTVAVGHGATQIVATARHVVVSAVTDHAIVVAPHDGGAPLRIPNDGPHWGFDARERVDDANELVIVAGGVEDHPLDRRDGYFGYVDSFAYVHRVRDGAVTRVAAVNLSELGVVTPKAMTIDVVDDERVEVLVTGYGNAGAARLAFGANGALEKKPIALVPGVRSMATTAKVRAMANPLLDAWVRLDANGVAVVPIPDEGARRDTRSRVGEALFFTTLMAPRNTSEGAHSRFTCETCHFEGYVDGRVHHTGREEIRATTKPLVGLVGNRPHFSRALDPDLSTVAHAEFRVAGAGNPEDPFFDLDPREAPWLAHLGVRDPLSALDLRRALMRFLVDFSHRPNPAVVGRTAFTPLERDGAKLFAQKCERCHSARLSADDATTRVPFERWEAMVMSEAAPIVWGSEGRRKTGVAPYVHPDGARTPSLRRLHKKHPYFTNGAAKSLDDVLDRVRVRGDDFFHDGAEDGARLDPAARAALRAFLEVL